ncbi:Separase [Camellia lanceoleosa]|uniref:Separase n=1 Tax=Camellia lanceoleosa TaxID=1840588 RepID=A0ACC0HHM9_9ERIC|nr:Separase [Camellia lanceoleosa]
MAASSVVCTWLVAACMSVACEKDQQQQPMMMMMNQSSSKRFSRWARKRRVLSKCRAGCSEIRKGRLISSGIQGLMSSYLPFEPCDEYYNSKGLFSFDFFGDNGFSSLFGSTNIPLSRRQRRFNRAVHSDASDNNTNSSSGILFEDKICVKRWHCPWGSTVVDYIAPVFRMILEENYLSLSMQCLEDTKKNRSLWWMQRKSLDQRFGKFLSLASVKPSALISGVLNLDLIGFIVLYLHRGFLISKILLLP